MRKLSKTANLVDISVSILAGTGIGVVVGLALTLALLKPINACFNNMETVAYGKVWKEKVEFE